MSDQWYYAKGGQQSGPVLLAQLLDMAQSGKLQRNDMVWRSGTPNWVQAGDVPELFPAGPAAAAPGAELGAAPRRREREWGGDNYSRPEPKKSRVGLILFLVFGGVGLLLLLCCGGVGLGIYFSIPKYDLNRTHHLPMGQSRTFPVQLTAGTKYTIELQSRDFDAYLILNDSRGRRLRSDDDGGRGLNSRIVFAPGASGRYQIVVQALGKRGGGMYTVKVRH